MDVMNNITYYANASRNVRKNTVYRCFHDRVLWNFDKMQIIFKAITESFGHAFWWERTVLHSMETLFDAGLVALESISPENVLTTVREGAAVHSRP